LNTGSYGDNGEWTDVTLLYDGSEATGEANGVNEKVLTINYTKPIGVLNSSLWEIDDSNGKRNITMDYDCWNYYSDKISFRVTLAGVGDGKSYHCLWSGGWKFIETHAIAGTFNEEAMWWNISGGNPQTSATTLTAGDEWNVTWQVNATGTIGQSYEVDTLFNSSYGNSNIPNNDTEDRTIEILSPYGYLDVSIDHPTDNLDVIQNNLFYINATVNCTGAAGTTCGTVYATARFNQTTANADENISIVTDATPLYGPNSGSGELVNFSDAFNAVTNIDLFSPGIAFDTSDNSLWILHNGENVISHWSLEGVDLDENISYTDMAAQGLAYDSSDDSFWTHNYSQGVANINQAGTQVFSFQSGLTGLTGIAYDASDDTLWICTYSDSTISHFDTDGADLGGDVDFSGMSLGNIIGCDIDPTDGTFWITEYSASEGAFLFHVDSDGNNLTDGFSPTIISGSANSSIWDGITYDQRGLGFWFSPFDIYETIHVGYNGTPQSNPQTSTTLSAGDEWNVTWQVNASGTIGQSYEIDAFFNSSYGNSLVPDNDTEDRTINIAATPGSNSTATIPSPVINSTDGLNLTSSTLNCSATISDTNGDGLNVTVYWYENETLKLETNYNNDYASGTAFNATLASSYTNIDDTWHCAMNVTDGQGFDSEGNSTSITIINGIPTDATTTLSTPSNTNYTNQNITATITGSSDGDGDTIYNITDWRLNGKSIAVVNMPFDTEESSTAAGAVRDYSTYETNGTLTVGNTWTASGKVGGAYAFEGGGDEITIPNPNINFTKGSISAWAKTGDTAQTELSIAFTGWGYL
ncbi:hypothetical protein N9934_05050, partial [Desulfosarcina sp.]|nr:hypothetical protein [Desulfosarcina sp.]